MSKSMLLENYARKITDIASENLGEEIVLFDTGEISLFSEFSICFNTKNGNINTTGTTPQIFKHSSP